MGIIGLIIKKDVESSIESNNFARINTIYKKNSKYKKKVITAIKNKITNGNPKYIINVIRQLNVEIIQNVLDIHILIEFYISESNNLNKSRDIIKNEFFELIEHMGYEKLASEFEDNYITCLLNEKNNIRLIPIYHIAVYLLKRKTELPSLCLKKLIYIAMNHNYEEIRHIFNAIRNNIFIDFTDIFLEVRDIDIIGKYSDCLSRAQFNIYNLSNKYITNIMENHIKKLRSDTVYFLIKQIDFVTLKEKKYLRIIQALLESNYIQTFMYELHIENFKETLYNFIATFMVKLDKLSYYPRLYEFIIFCNMELNLGFDEQLNSLKKCDKCQKMVCSGSPCPYSKFVLHFGKMLFVKLCDIADHNMPIEAIFEFLSTVDKKYDNIATTLISYIRPEYNLVEDTEILIYCSSCRSVLNLLKDKNVKSIFENQIINKNILDNYVYDNPESNSNESKCGHHQCSLLYMKH